MLANVAVIDREKTACPSHLEITAKFARLGRFALFRRQDSNSWSSDDTLNSFLDTDDELFL